MLKPLALHTHTGEFNEERIEKKLRSEKGSITVFVLAAMLFMLVITTVFYTSVKTKTVAQAKDINKIQEEYSKEENLEDEMEEKYEDIKDTVDTGVIIRLYKLTGEEYQVSEWTNQDIKMRLDYYGGTEPEDKYFYIDGEKVDYVEDYLIKDNCTITAEYMGKKSEVVVSRIDKENPTIKLEYDGGTYTITPGNTTATINTKLTAEDNGGSGVATRQYVWSTSVTTEPTTGWINFTDEETITANKGGGTHYLWIKVLDTAGNRCGTMVSNAFVVNYQVVYNANGGTGAPGEQVKRKGSNLTLSSTKPIKEGASFLGWSTSKTSTTPNYQPGSIYTEDNSIVLYAIWQNYTYTVEYNGNGATSGTTPDSIHTYGEEKALTANKYIRQYTVTYNYNGSGGENTKAIANYSFKNWNTDSNGSGTSYSNAQKVINLSNVNNGKVTLYAQWNTGKVTLPSASRTNYIFEGWYSEAACTNKIGDAGDSYTPNKDIVLYAKWTAANYSINTSPIQYVKTLAEAVKNANSGSTIKVLRNVTDNSSGTINKNLTLSTNGYTLTRQADITINSGITLILTGTGTLKNSTSQNVLNNNGTLNITHTGTISYSGTNTSGTVIKNNGTLKVTSAVKMNSTISVINNKEGGVTTLSGGTYTVSGSSASTLLTNEAGGTVTINDGTTMNANKMPASYTNGVVVNYGNLTMNGGKIYSSDNTFNGTGIASVGKLVVKAGSINTGTNGYYGIYSAGTTSDKTVTIQGGNIFGKEAGFYHSSPANVIIQDATIKGDVGGMAIEKASKGASITVKGDTEILSDKGSGIFILGEANVNINSGKIIGAEYGIHSNITTPNLIQIGANGDAFSETKVIVLGKKQYGLSLDDKSFKFQFKNGKILGGKDAYRGTPTNIRSGYSYYTGTGTYEGVTYKKASMKAK